jgi:hypothetical protein
MRWLSNKTPEIVASWIAHPKASVLVAVERGTILAVGSVTNAGEITLNYVSPDARFRGVSRALLGALEARAIQRGNVRCTLTSTETARRFYHANGYVEDGPVAGKLIARDPHTSAPPSACCGAKSRPMPLRLNRERPHSHGLRGDCMAIYGAS